MALKQRAGRCYLPGMVDATFDVIGLALNATPGVAVVGAVGWMLSGS